ncbi:MAG: hypothetical protein KME26_27885 [Oscillatoria princeps RMCB-10]|nr:hypothetical protein [Oscillatoria princeps RMCB-10]
MSHAVGASHLSKCRRRCLRRAGAGETRVPVPVRGGRAGYGGFKSLQLEYLGFVGGSL